MLLEEYVHGKCMEMRGLNIHGKQQREHTGLRQSFQISLKSRPSNCHRAGKALAMDHAPLFGALNLHQKTKHCIFLA